MHIADSLTCKCLFIVLSKLIVLFINHCAWVAIATGNMARECYDEIHTQEKYLQY